MVLLRKFRETSFSVLPIVFIVFLLNLFVAPIGWLAFGKFLLGSIAIIIGLSLFLLGTDIGIIPTATRIGSKLTENRNVSLLIFSGLIMGFLITLAEPQIHVLSSQISSYAPSLHKTQLIIAISAGMGLFLAIGLARIIFGLSYRWLLVGVFAIIETLAALSERFFIGIAFDSGGAATGPMTVPFILALGIGVSNVRQSETSDQDSFGLVGLSTMGPVPILLFFGLLSRGISADAIVDASGDTLIQWGALIGRTTIEVLQALAPIAAAFFVFQITLLKQSAKRVIRMVEGLVYAALGLILFLVGVSGAFMPVGSVIGSLIGSLDQRWILIPIGFFLGAVVVLAEPSVWVLTDQIKEISAGAIKKPMVMIFFSIGVSASLALAMARIVFEIPLLYILIPGYVSALVLSFFAPPLFTAIAFDSGAVASGPISNSFLLAFTLGAASSASVNPFASAFGVVALITMTPLITLQLLGLLYKRRVQGERNE